ncbi:MAG: 16S rRNA (cytosine(1402)-N(4))-methyltransferase RsmH [Chloroflexi bacterium]|nr:MAG: 16S rRNA (cytosine(1402)-N(4))-methyltransferase RsmH [Chloroflexota bacterium]
MTEEAPSEFHTPVLLKTVLDALIPDKDNPPQRIIDGTLGAGGHTRAFLDAGVQEVLGLDVDPQALAIARENLAPYGGRIHIVHASYTTMAAEAQRLGWDAVDGILLDLGVSSMQLDTPERGFAFRHDAPLDMRFTPNSDLPTAADILNTYDATQLAEIFFRYGEERYSRQIARAVVNARPLSTTRQLADLIAKTVPRPKKQKGRKDNIHPATRVFQALRIAVNEELQAVEAVLPMAIALLRPGGRLGVISFHSLEDRIVKQYFRDAAIEIVPPPGMASLPARQAQVRLITRKPLMAAEEEIAQNPRSRSAKLRIVEKLG